ncbi:hypothetical protein [Streptomyces sp. NPDC058678]|uniref:hypothetical protein n=1 Tax=Streptomyces sp. NPDC058678 TaxID=3346595 RepID=UPI00366703AA
MRKRLAYGIGTGAAVAASVLLAAGPAAAADSDLRVRTKASGDYAYMAGTEDFHADGDKIEVCDNRGDGAGVGGYWKIGSGGDVTKIYNGNGLSGGCEWRNYEFAESATVYLRVCLQDNGDFKESTCSAWNSVRANGD